MKILTTLTIIFLLAGCSMLAPKFDNHEYSEFVYLSTHTKYLLEECGTERVFQRLQLMHSKTTSLLTYATYIPNNDEIIGMATIIDDDIQEILDRARPINKYDKMSKTYCQLKAKQLLIKLNEALESIGNLN